MDAISSITDQSIFKPTLTFSCAKKQFLYQKDLIYFFDQIIYAQFVCI